MDTEVVRLEASVGFLLGGGEACLEVGQQNACFGSSGRVFQAF